MHVSQTTKQPPTYFQMGQKLTLEQKELHDSNHYRLHLAPDRCHSARSTWGMKLKMETSWDNLTTHRDPRLSILCGKGILLLFQISGNPWFLHLFQVHKDNSLWKPLKLLDYLHIVYQSFKIPIKRIILKPPVWLWCCLIIYRDI